MPSKPSPKAARLAELVRKGLDDLVIAERLGMTRASVENMRVRNGLSANRVVR